METCYYCGECYHPMPVYVKIREAGGNGLPYRIHVCHFHYNSITGNLDKSDCQDKAVKDGYEFRRDLTPRR